MPFAHQSMGSSGTRKWAGESNMRQADAATSPTIPRTHFPFPPLIFEPADAAAALNRPNTMSPACGPYVQLCPVPSMAKLSNCSLVDSNHNSRLISTDAQTEAQLQILRNAASLNASPATSCSICMAMQLQPISLSSAQLLPSNAITSFSAYTGSTHSAPSSAGLSPSRMAIDQRPDSRCSIELQWTSPTRLGIHRKQSSIRSTDATPSPLPGSGRTSAIMMRSPALISPPAFSGACASSVAGESQAESPTIAYLDNNDSVNIFNKYQTGPSNTPFTNYFLNQPKVHGCFRKSVPTMPLLVAIILCILNWFLPGSGTLLSSLAILCGCKTEYGKDQWQTAFLLCVLASLLQFTSAIFVIGWVWSIMWGVNFIKNATKKRNKKYLLELERGIAHL